MLKRFFKRVFPGLVVFRRRVLHLFDLYNLKVDAQIRARQLAHPNPLTRYGRKGYSQTDEDGITFEIIRRLQIQDGCFAEFGVGDGTENNTLSLLALGWRGFWVGGETLAFDWTKSSRLHYERSWVTLENIVTSYREGLSALKADALDLVSLDLDGNDLYFIEALLQAGCLPKLFIAEYNAKFPPPMRFTIDYDARHSWDGSDYQGVSLYSLNELFEKHGYSLIACNAATGANAFFVRNEYRDRFPEVPTALDQLYAAPAFFLFDRYAHPTSIRTIETIIR